MLRLRTRGWSGYTAQKKGDWLRRSYGIEYCEMRSIFFLALRF